MKVRPTHLLRFALNLLLLAGFFLCAQPIALAASSLELTGVRIGVHPDKTRIVVDLSEGTPFRYFTLADPYRVVLDLPEVSIPKGSRIAGKGGAVQALRHGLFEPGTHRFVFDLSKPVRLSKPFILPSSGTRPARLVLDFMPATRDEFERASAELMSVYRRARQAERPRAPEVKSIQPEDLIQPARPGGKRVIVVDAGHGGVDPGAIAQNGTYEKTIALTAALELRDALERTGKFRVVMTRDTDVFLRLRQRVQVARDVGASLFISLHADSLGDKNHRGASVYTLSETASDKEAARLARKENKADTIAGVDLTDDSSVVQSILIDLAQRETMNLSVRFAADLVKELDGVVLLQRRHHRFAGFAVLKAPDVPSVLFEMGYLSNKEDLKLMQNAAHRKRMVNAVARAVEQHFQESDRLSRS